MMAENVIPLNAWRGQLDMGEKGVRRNLTNLMMHLRNLEGLGRSIRFNELSMQAEWNGHPMTEEDILDVRLIIEKANFQPIDKDVRPAIMRLAHENSYHPVCDYLNGIVWDKKPRIDKWLHKLLGCAETEYVQAISPKVLISAVARAFKPGSQVDTMLVIEGDQGIKKSSAIKALFGEDFTYEIVSGFDDHRRLITNIIGAWAVELAEFVSVQRSATGSVKGLVTIRRDRVQLPYARGLSDLPRRFIFVGTINPGASGYLDDDTGNRRYWPVTATKCDIEAIVANRDQMWAEAVHRFRQGERWWLDERESDIALIQTQDRASTDPWIEILRERFVDFQGKYVTSTLALSKIGVPAERMDKATEMRATSCLKALGYVRKKGRFEQGGKAIWAWVKS